MNTQSNAEDTTSSPTRPTAIVVGAGFGGIGADNDEASPYRRRPLCRFGDAVTNATIVSDSRVACDSCPAMTILRPLPEDRVGTSLRTVIGGECLGLVPHFFPFSTFGRHQYQCVVPQKMRTRPSSNSVPPKTARPK